MGARRRWGDGAAGEAGLARRCVTNTLGSGSDYTVFLNFLGLPIVDMSFDGPYGVYHSMYDDYYWMAHFGDPGFRYMTTMADVWGRMALRLANAPVLPLDYATYAERVGGFIDDLAAVPGVKQHLDLNALRGGAAALARERQGARAGAGASAHEGGRAPPTG